ncbi:surfeit locus protein 6-domain-containing protein [Phlyctochytrium arcticum]|nr:surfeit locus protein 6-domain-containing protein [Phlyctochytrium arcticum]
MAVETDPDVPLVEQLQGRLQRTQTCFDSLVQLIPAKYYKQQETEDFGKFQHNKKNKAPKQLVKEATKRAKRAKYDPESATKASDDVEAVPDQPIVPLERLHGNSNNCLALAAISEFSTEPNTSTGSILELREKLQTRIRELQAKRNVEGNVVMPQSRQEILEKRAKRKRERKEGIKKQKDKRRKLEDTKGMSLENGDSQTNSEHPKGTVPAQAVMFGKLDFGIDEKPRKKPAVDVAAQLKNVEKKQQKLEELKATRKDDALKIEEAAAWSKVMKQAEGTKIKDDVKLLKKSVKRKEKAKEKSSVAWMQRQSSLKKDQDDRLKRRETNLKARSEGRTTERAPSNKPKKQRPGFEGGGRKKAT